MKGTNNSPKGIANNYYYPQRNAYGIFQASVTGKKVKFDYSNYSSSFSQNMFQMNPFKTVSFYKNEHCSEINNTVNGTNNFTINKSNIKGNQNANLYPIYYQITNPPYREPITDYANYYTYLQSPVDVVKTYAKKAYLNFTVKVDAFNPEYPVITISGLTGTSYTSIAASSVFVTMSNNSNYVNMRVDVTPIIDAIKNSNNQLHGFGFKCGKIEKDGQVGYTFTGNPVLEYTTVTNDTLQVYTAFDKRGNLKFKVDENSIYSEYYYDALGRPTNTAMPLSFYDGVNTNYSSITSYDDVNNTVTETVRINNTPSALLSVERKSYFDSFGNLRLDQAKNESGTYETKSDKTYNYMGLVSQEKDGEGRIKKYYYDYLQRPIKIENGDLTNKTIEYFKQSNTLESGTLWQTSYSEYTKAVDENKDENLAVYTYFDLVGNKVAEKIGNNKPTVFKYDDAYRLIQVISPAGKTVNYYYDDLGNLSKKESPADEGTTMTKFDRYNRLRFSMNASAPSTERGITFQKYDSKDRVLLVGTLPSNYGFNSLEADKDYSTSYSVGHFEDVKTDTANFVTVNMYDVYRKEGVFKQMPDPFTWLQYDANSSRNLRGNLVATAFRDKPGQGWNYKIYLYDQLGRVNHMYIKVGRNSWKLVFTQTDNIGNKQLQGICKVGGGSQIGEQFAWYNYDNLGRLKDVRSNSVYDYNTAKVEATYTYNKADQCSTLTNNQVSGSRSLTTFGYEPNRGWLKNINNGSGMFTETLGFYNNGNIASQAVVNISLRSQTLSYNYDGMNRLASVYSGSTLMESFLYDADGNPTKRQYNTQPSGGAAYNQIEYYYNGNRLSYIYFNGTKKYFGYDVNGNVTYDEFNQLSSQYDHRNLPLWMGSAKYRYDDEGQRTYKEANGKKEYYLRDDKGLELAVYDAAMDRLSLVNLYGNDLIGRIDINYTSQYDPEADEYVDTRTDRKIYYVKDHLGSIRLGFDVNGVPVSAFDYYAFGQLFSSFTTGSAGEKYKFTSKERDSETGLDYFG
ncbi:MAG: RHS repeat protein, partial [Ignavibacteria bacterium]|nr:RHS repeat protein [Ignavibacteria bacterium]